MAAKKPYSTQEFERFARAISDKLGEITRRGVFRLSTQILLDIMHDPRLKGSTFQGPAGRIVTVGESDELAEATARAVLEITPAVRFIDIYPKTKKVLKFEWPLAPIGVRFDDSQPNFPTVYYKHVRVPVPVPIDDLDTRAQKQFDSTQFQSWLGKMIDKEFVTLNIK